MKKERANYKIQILFSFFIVSILSAVPVYAQQRAVRTIQLGDLFQLANENSKAIELSLIDMKISAEKTNDSKRSKLPHFGINATAAYMGDVSVLGLGTTMSSGTYSGPNFFNNYSAEAAWTILAGGNQNRTVSMSQLEQKIARYNLKSTTMDIYLMLAGYYLDMYVSWNQQKVYEKNIQQTKVLLKDMANRLKAGTIVKSDLIRYQLRLSQLKFNLLQVNNKIDVLNKKLTETLDLSDSVLLNPLAPSMITTLDTTDISQREILNNTDIQKAIVERDLAAKQFKMEKKNLLPSLSLFASTNMTRPFVYDIPNIDIYYNVWMVGAKLSIPIDRLYRNKSKINRASTRCTESQIHLDFVKEQKRISLHEAVVNYNESVKHLDVAKKQVELATENYTMIINQYDNQLALITDVMDASNEKLNAELQLENAKAAIQFACYKVQREVGTLGSSYLKSIDKQPLNLNAENK